MAKAFQHEALEVTQTKWHKNCVHQQGLRACQKFFPRCFQTGRSQSRRHQHLITYGNGRRGQLSLFGPFASSGQCMYVIFPLLQFDALRVFPYLVQLVLHTCEQPQAWDRTKKRRSRGKTGDFKIPSYSCGGLYVVKNGLLSGGEQDV